MNRRTYSAAAMRGKRSRDIGAAGETLVRAELQRLGMREIERVHTPFKILRDSKGQIKDAVPQEKVSGDFRCVDPTGKSVLVEAKTHVATDRVCWSDFEDHQIEALNRHVRCNARAFIAVVLQDRAWVLQWPVDGFGPGKSIKVLQGRLFLSSGRTRSTDAPKSFPGEESSPILKIGGGDDCT